MRKPGRKMEGELGALARRVAEAAVEITGDDPLRATSVRAISNHLSLVDREEIDRAIAEAARLGWLRTNDDKSISVTATWRRQRSPPGRGVLPALRRSHD